MPNRSKFPKINAFLNGIAQNESSGASPDDFSVRHPVVKYGLQAGQEAIGAYGLLPNTSDEMINRLSTEGKATPELKALRGLSSDELKEKFSENPQLYRDITDRLVQHVFRDTDDPAIAAYRWKMGHNKSLASIDPNAVANNDYVNKFKATTQAMSRPLASENEEE